MSAFWYCNCRHPHTKVYYADEIDKLQAERDQLRAALKEILTVCAGAAHLGISGGLAERLSCGQIAGRALGPLYVERH